jgi:hypothetical protein
VALSFFLFIFFLPLPSFFSSSLYRVFPFLFFPSFLFSSVSLCFFLSDLFLHQIAAPAAACREEVVMCSIYGVDDDAGERGAAGGSGGAGDDLLEEARVRLS